MLKPNAVNTLPLAQLHTVFQPEAVATIEAARAAEPTRRLEIQFIFAAKSAPCTCGCADHDQCRQDRMKAAAQEVRGHVDTLTKDVDLFANGNGKPAGSPECQCPVCVSGRIAKIALGNLAASYSERAYNSDMDFNYRKYQRESRRWKELADSIQAPHGKGGGQ